MCHGKRSLPVEIILSRPRFKKPPLGGSGCLVFRVSFGYGTGYARIRNGNAKISSLHFEVLNHAVVLIIIILYIAPIRYGHHVVTIGLVLLSNTYKSPRWALQHRHCGVVTAVFVFKVAATVKRIAQRIRVSPGTAQSAFKVQPKEQSFIGVVSRGTFEVARPGSCTCAPPTRRSHSRPLRCDCPTQVPFRGDTGAVHARRVRLGSLSS